MFSTHMALYPVSLDAVICVTAFMLIFFFISPARHIYNYWAAGRDFERAQDRIFHYVKGFLGFFTFHFFGPLSYDKIDDPFDMTEAWEEFRLRAEVGRILASRDKDGDGFVDITVRLLKVVCAGVSM